MWLKGNLHAHTTNSDGDSPPDAVAAWYRDHGYDFLSLTDHNCLTAPDSVSRAAVGDMFLIPGEEITMAHGVHVNALNVEHEIAPPAGKWRSRGDELLAAVRRSAGGDAGAGRAKLRLLEAALAAAGAQGALASVNHPNYRWALDAALLSRLRELRFFEVFNGHPACFNEGDAEHWSTERLWDRLLSAGKRVFGLATDDAHELHGWGPRYSNPGRGWVFVDAADRTGRAVQQALEAGRFYASTGIRLEGLKEAADRIELAIEPTPGESYEVLFVSDEGRVVETCTGSAATCGLPQGATYLRAVVRGSSGAQAWVQPIFGRSHS